MLTETAPEPLQRTIAEVQALADTRPATPEALSETLGKIYWTLFELDLTALDTQAVREHAPEAIGALQALYFQLRGSIPAWHADGLFKAAAQHRLRDCFRALRMAVDMLGETWIDFEHIDDPKQLLQMFTGTNFNTLPHPGLFGQESIAFQSGDVILMRGGHHNSAAIAMIGDIDSQFSHVGMVYIDGSGRHWTVEALIEEGSHIVPLEQTLNAGSARAIVFRHHDARVAARAAQIAYDRVDASRTGRTRHIPYDFSMRLDGGRRLFCSKLIRQSYLAASDGKIALPAFPTVLGMKNRDFFNRIGVKTRETFAPGDMELDPNFKIVAEWRDYRMTSRLRLQDLTMAKFFEWMDTRNFVFHETMTVHLISWLGRLSGQFSNTAKNLIRDVVPKVPAHMKRRTIAAIAMLHRTADPVVMALQEAEREHIAATGAPMHPKLVRAQLEELRQEAGGYVGYLRPLA